MCDWSYFHYSYLDDNENRYQDKYQDILFSVIIADHQSDFKSTFNQ